MQGINEMQAAGNLMGGNAGGAQLQHDIADAAVLVLTRYVWKSLCHTAEVANVPAPDRGQFAAFLGTADSATKTRTSGKPLCNDTWVCLLRIVVC